MPAHAKHASLSPQLDQISQQSWSIKTERVNLGIHQQVTLEHGFPLMLLSGTHFYQHVTDALLYFHYKKIEFSNFLFFLSLVAGDYQMYSERGPMWGRVESFELTLLRQKVLFKPCVISPHFGKVIFIITVLMTIYLSKSPSSASVHLLRLWQPLCLTKLSTVIFISLLKRNTFAI